VHVDVVTRRFDQDDRVLLDVMFPMIRVTTETVNQQD